MISIVSDLIGGGKKIIVCIFLLLSATCKKINERKMSLFGQYL